MKSKAKAILKRIWQAVSIIATTGMAAVTIAYVGVFVIQLLHGQVDSLVALFTLVVAIMAAVAIKDILHEKQEAATIKKYYKEYRIKTTAAAFLFMNKGQLTNRELMRFMSIMRYTARENNWEEVNENEMERREKTNAAGTEEKNE